MMMKSRRTRYSPIAFDVGELTTELCQIAVDERGARVHARSQATEPLRRRPLDDPTRATSWRRAERLYRQGDYRGEDVMWLARPPDVTTVALSVPTPLLSQPRGTCLNAIRVQAAREAQREAEGLIADYWIPPASRLRSLSMTEILVAVIDGAVVRERAAFFESLGLSLVEVDILPLSLLRACPRPAAPEQGRALWGVLELGFRGAILSLALGTECVFVRNINVDGDALTLALVDALEVDYGAAERLKRQWGATGASEYRAFARAVALPESLERTVKSTIKGTLRILATEVESAFTYVMQQHSEAVPAETALWVCGGSSRISGLCEQLSEQLGVQVLTLEAAHVGCGDATNDAAARYSPALSSLIGHAT